ncbi:karyopherin Kap104 [Saitoella complicata NRRL Y-17804]|uniref:karyopherin Kap104 n=1 Tax=Saitoella complicata (strain BCRC 22490 / CBS 7301 / JCM 7358 / NBRC 10748 / NRRL Y-17804) TaxID=698492 RepID=UPI000866E1E0|nr:karyopherin Kap104 [Saitoella complicata NRRL Y-17804]ODQ54556.1 karyopherin Kap104 [Saitoella complicata NRRL Y-17804]
MSWNGPDQATLAQLTQILQNSISESAQARNAANQHLEQAKSLPDLNNYLAYILVRSTDQEIPVRSAAGLLLKNNARLYYHDIAEPVLNFVKEAVLNGLADDQHLIRSIAGNVITTIVSRGGVIAWPEVLPRLMDMLDNSTGATQEGAFSALCKICEDSSHELDQDYNGQRPLNFMIPKFLTFCENPNPKLRENAIFCLNQFVMIKSQSLNIHIDSFLAAIFNLATDTTPEVRKNVCQALVQLLDARPDKIEPNLNSIVEYMMYSTSDDDETVALEACEFWLTIAENDDLRLKLEPYLPRIVPMLLKGMIYTDMDVFALGGDEDDANVPDRLEDIKPVFAHGKKHTLQSQGAGNGNAGGDGDDDEDDEDYDDDEEDEDDIYAEWNLRKCSAAALDVLATVFPMSLLQSALPHLKEQLFNADWKVREAGVLALGAIADGCMDGIMPHLPEIFPYLISLLKDPKPLVRQITCWTLGRYARWAAALTTEAEMKMYYEPLVEGLLRMVLDNHKRVQEAGCSAFANLEEISGAVLLPYMIPILKSFQMAFQKYQHKNLLILYDAVQTLADSIGGALNNSDYINLLMPPLIEKWQALADDDRDLFPLLECLSAVTAALGSGFIPFAQPVFSRCIHILSSTIAQLQACAQDPSLEWPDKDFLITSLDLLSGVVQALGQNSSQLMLTSNPPVVQLLSVCMQDEVAEVRQSAYALLGDMAIQCFDTIRPYIQSVMTELIPQIEPRTDAFSVCNNAAWAAGEIALQMGAEMAPWVEQLMGRLVPLLNAKGTPHTVRENAAITLGRLGLVCAEPVAAQLDQYAASWCEVLANVRDNEEKDSAFRGMCTIISKNPNALNPYFIQFCTAVGRWQEPSAELANMFHQILIGYKSIMDPATWAQSLQHLTPEVQAGLQKYGA